MKPNQMDQPTKPDGIPEEVWEIMPPKFKELHHELEALRKDDPEGFVRRMSQLIFDGVNKLATIPRQNRSVTSEQLFTCCLPLVRMGVAPMEQTAAAIYASAYEDGRNFQRSIGAS